MSEANKTTQYEDFTDFFSQTLEISDPKLFDSLRLELKRQQEQIELIASENIVSRSVLDAQGSIMTNKYAEGYSGRRYYGGCEYVDIAEDYAISRACDLFDVKFANVQPHSGSQANQAVFQSLLKPGDNGLLFFRIGFAVFPKNCPFKFASFLSLIDIGVASRNRSFFK